MKTQALLISLILVGCGSPKEAQKSGVAVTIKPASTALDSASTDSITAELGACDASKLAEVCFSNNTQNYYYCSMSGNWSQTTIFPTTPKATPAPDKGQNCIGSPAKALPASDTVSNSTESSNDYVSSKTGLTWVFGNTLSSNDLKQSNVNVFSTDFLCPPGTKAPSQAQFAKEFSSGFVDWLGPKFAIAGVVNALYQDSYYLIAADAQGNFDLVNALQVTSITAICVKQ